MTVDLEWRKHRHRRDSEREIRTTETRVELTPDVIMRIDQLESDVAELRAGLAKRPIPANDSMIPGLQDIVQRLVSLTDRVKAVEAEAANKSRWPAPIVVDSNSTNIATLADRVDALEQFTIAAGDIQTEMSSVLGLMGAFVEKIDTVARQSTEGHQIASEAMACIKIAAGMGGER